MRIAERTSSDVVREMRLCRYCGQRPAKRWGSCDETEACRKAADREFDEALERILRKNERQN